MATSTYSIILNGSALGLNSNTTLGNNPSVYSISLWFKYTSSTNGMIFIGKGTVLGTTFWCLRTSVGTLVFGNSDFMGSTESATSSLYNDGNWHNFVGTYHELGSGPAKETHIYIDGVLASVTYADSYRHIDTNNPTIPLSIGGGNTGSSLPKYTGQLDDIRIWIGTELSLTDAVTIAAGGDPSTSATAYWRCEEGSGVVLNDSIDSNTITFNTLAWSTDVPSPLIPPIPLTLTLTDSVSSSDTTVKEDEKTLTDSITSSDILALARAQNVSDSMTVTDSFTAQSDHIATVQAPIVENLVNQLCPAEVKTFFRLVE